MVEPFVCKEWQKGQRCKPYFTIHWAYRLVPAVLGASIAVAPATIACAKAVQDSPPVGPVAMTVIVIAGLIAGCWTGGIMLAMHNEHDLWGSFVSSVGTPAIFLALVNLSQLGK